MTSASGATTSGAKGLDSILKQFKEKAYKNVANLHAVTKELNNEHLVEGVGLYMKLMDNQEAVFRTMDACSKPADMNFMVQIAKDNKQLMVKLGKPGRAVGTHLRCLEDSVNIFVWFMCSDKP